MKATETTIFQGLTIREIIQTNATLPTPKQAISRQTVRRYTSSLGGFTRWLEKRGYLPYNPVAGMMPAKGEGVKRDSFTVPAMNTLFASPLFSSCAGDEWPHATKPGAVEETPDATPPAEGGIVPAIFAPRQSSQ